MLGLIIFVTNLFDSKLVFVYEAISIKYSTVGYHNLQLRCTVKDLRNRKIPYNKSTLEIPSLCVLSQALFNTLLIHNTL